MMILLLSSLVSCSQDEDVTPTNEYSSKQSHVNYRKLISDYNMTTVTDETSIQKAEGLEALTPQKANEVLSTLFSSSTIPLSIDPNLSTRSKVVVISGTNKECRAEVHLDIDNVKVVTSDVFYTGLMDVFLVYTHSSDSTTKSGNRINFTVKGEVLIRIIWQGIELKRVPVTMEGYYDIDKGSGSLTFF